MYPDMVVRCMDSTKSRYKFCIGFCSNCNHQGYITERLQKEHNCLNKHCHYFKPIKDNSYWRRKNEEDKVKQTIKRIRKERKQYENEILNRVPEDVKAVLSKHLYDKTYLLAIEGGYLSEDLFGDIDVNLYIKQISPEESTNFDVTFLKSLPEEMQERYRKEQQRIKNDQINKRRG